MGMTYATLPTGMRLPQRSHFNHEIFCRDALVEHQVAPHQRGSLSVQTHRLGLEVIEQGVLHGNITCAHCLQGLNHEVEA